MVNQFWSTNFRSLLDNLKRIKIDNPVDKIIKQIRNLISEGEIVSGQKLPPERKLAIHLGVSRGQVREALRKLEFYGILKTVPQSGTIVTGMGIVALEGLITDVLQIEESDFKSLVETRILLEKQTSLLAAKRRTESDIKILKNALLAYEKKIMTGDPAVEEDLMFHIKIAEASKNNVLKSLMMIITPDIINSFKKFKVCTESKNLVTRDGHNEILNHIIDQQPLKASYAMGQHLNELLNFSISNSFT